MSEIEDVRETESKLKNKQYFRMRAYIQGSAFAASPRSVSGREAVPDEVFAAMVRRILGSCLLSLHDLFPGERVRQRSYLK